MKLTMSILDGRQTTLLFWAYALLAHFVEGRNDNGKSNNNEGLDPSFLDHNIDKHAIFTLPLSQGAYDFDMDGFIPKLPLERMGGIHKEMVGAIQKVPDRKKQIQNILSVSNTINKDLDQLKYKIEQNGLPAKEIDKRALKADERETPTLVDTILVIVACLFLLPSPAFIFLAGHAALMCSFVLYFPDIMKQLLIKNPTFDTNVKWAIEFTIDAKLIKEEKLVKPFNLAQQELEMIPKDPDYQNPYKYEYRIKQEPTPITTTTKKPRKRLQRGPRMSGGEL